MSGSDRVVSPDGRYVIVLDAVEMRMSHWVFNGVLQDVMRDGAELWLGGHLWSTERVTWSADSAMVTVEMRKYPGDAPSLTLDIYPGRDLIRSHAPAAESELTFHQLAGFLDRFYSTHRRQP